MVEERPKLYNEFDLAGSYIYCDCDEMPQLEQFLQTFIPRTQQIE